MLFLFVDRDCISQSQLNKNNQPIRNVIISRHIFIKSHPINVDGVVLTIIV